MGLFDFFTRLFRGGPEKVGWEDGGAAIKSVADGPDAVNRSHEFARQNGVTIAPGNPSQFRTRDGITYLKFTVDKPPS